MASGGLNDCNLQLNDSIDKSKSKKHSSEHEETIKSDQMAAKKFDEKPHIEDFDETQLKSLLDEAMDYKNPRDANDKSDTFKQLLKNVTEEDMKRDERYNLGKFGIKQSNSLQNLLDESHYQSSSHQSHTSSKKHHQQRRKNSTSVSARRLEGGSLPIDMHHSSSAVQSPPDFLSEFRKKKETVIDIGENDTDEKKLMQQRHWDCNKDSISSSSYPYDGIEMKSMSYTNTVDLEVEDMSRYSSHTHPTITTISSMTPAGGPPIATASIINPKVTSSAVATSSTMHSVDKIIEFPSLIEKGKMYQQQHQLIDVYSSAMHSNNIVLANQELTFSSPSGKGFSGLDALPLNSGYNSVTSLTNNEKASAKTYMNKQSNHDTNPVNTLIQTAPMISAAHQPGSAANSKEAKSKAKRAKAQERNEKTIDVQMIDGFRGTDKVEDLLRYIEDGGKEQHKSHPKNGMVSSHQTSDHLLSAEEKKKKMAAKNKEKVNKLKKSNSMDELCSTGRQEQQQEEKSSTTAANKIIEDVTLRSKSSNLTSGAKKGDKNEKSQHKRNERRSWGTEGLWTEATPAAEQSRDNQEEHQEVESSSSSTSSGVPSELHILDPIASIEPATAVVSETEFHVVTKKRKVKRKASEGADLGKTSNHLQSYNMKRDGNNRPGTKHYNDRGDMGPKTPRNSKPLNQDAKVSTGKNRRKSTSSMPPSDDDWNSDGGDSVQSLPIETTKTTSSQLLSTAPVLNEATSSSGGKGKKNANASHHQHQQKPATFSYADIAKTNANRNSGTNVTTSTEKWPSISASSSSSTTHQNNNDPFSIANFEAAVSNSTSNPKSQQQHQKSAPITTSMMSFPELVESNNNKNKQLSSNPSSSSLENALNGETINTTEKPLNGLDTPRAFDNNNNTNSNVVVADDRLNNNQKISYSQSLLENNHQEVDSNGNNVKTEIINGSIVKATLTKSKSVDHNNLSSIEHYPALEKTQATLGEVFNSKAAVVFETYASKSKQKQLKPELKPAKKDKLKKSLSVQGPQFPQQNAILNCRPAVIILNDCTKPTDADCGITFGFDINEHLLFGQQNGDDAGCLTDVSLETNNNNNCDITNTNLSSNNLTNQPCVGVEMYEQFIAPQNIIIGGSEVHIIALSQSSPQQSHASDTSNQSSNDIGYLSSSLITNSMSPATQKSSSSMPNDEHHDVQEEDAELQRIPMELKRVAISDVHQLVLPQFILPGPVKFNQEELVSFVSDEWTKFIRNGVYFNGQ